MLPDLDWPARLAALALALGVVALHGWRAASKDRREYRRFRRYRSTARRQAAMRRWLRESFVLLGGSAVVLIALVHPVVEPLLRAAQALPGVTAVRDALGSGLGLGLLAGAVLGTAVATAAGIRSARREGGVVMIGDIAALLPRNRPELVIGVGLSVNAGVVEELLFRLAMPALLVLVTGEPLSALLLSALLFGLLHAYQGWAGMAGATAIGLVLTVVYVLSGSILLVIALHVLLDLRTLVLIPAAVYGVHRVPGSVRMPPVLRPLAIDRTSDEAVTGSATEQ
ncbi:CPBP family intramembrane metalloprotease [Microcella daejeonensis]|uniref:CPBP family intramembrane metalloprotease n=1 Tax=Microcella daejeonensis TaxID=2994971 RepID=A0A9E8MJ74_9MICO|nr:CPBP family intramembrane glutamic endopeptidase [Microcella daejeonensis]WAB80549.1 CPBP family intramembrane metalloprotease [Microcella daejeonensis]